MDIDIALVGRGEILAGAGPGKKVFRKLLEKTQNEITEPELVFLDFRNVEVATASFLRESVVAYRDTIRGRRSPYYPVVANANMNVIEELGALTELRGDVLMSCSKTSSGKVTEVQPIGTLEAKQQVTFDLVSRKGETDAGELWRNTVDQEGVSQTAWNNRLASLAALGLVVEVRHGRSKRYRPLWVG